MDEDVGTSRPLKRRGFIAGALGALGATLFARTDNAAAQEPFPPEEEVVLQRTLRFRQANEGVSAVSARRANDIGTLGAVGRTGEMPLDLDSAAVAGISANNVGVVGNSPNLAVLGVTDNLRSLPPTTVTVTAVVGAARENTGVWGASESGVGVWGTSGNVGVQGASPNTGVLGLTDNVTDPGRYPVDVTATAVVGLARENTGIWGASESGIGVWGTSGWVGMQGWSPWGIGVLGATAMQDWDVGQQWPPAGVFAVSRDEVGMWAISQKNIASWGASDEFIGVQGIGGHIGAWFIRGQAPEIGQNPGGIDARQLEPAALHTTALGSDVSACFRAEHGVAAMAEAMHHDGVALKTMGRIQSDLVGKGVIPAGKTETVTPCGHVTPDSHVQITFQGNPGAGNAHWVTLDPGKGFALKLARPAQGDLPFTFSVVEAIGTGPPDDN